MPVKKTNLFTASSIENAVKTFPLHELSSGAVNRKSASAPKNNPKTAPKGPEDFPTPVCVFPVMSHDASAPLGADC